MPKQEGQKYKMVALLQILQQYTDEQHSLNVPQLIARLEKQGIICERKSIYTDVAALNRLGYDISMRRGRHGGYWMAHRTFDLAELKLLVDAVQSSRFITQRRSLALIKKLESLASKYEAQDLQRNVYVGGRPKTENRHLLYSVDSLHRAISAGCMVSFKYKHGDKAPELHTVSPWQMAWENDRYYLIAYQDEKAPANIRHYRVDRMADVKLLEDEPRRGKEQFESFDLPAYLKMHFNMYGGPRALVTLRCEQDLRETMQDRFGKEPIFVDEDDKHFHFDTQVCVSEQFFGWVFGFGGKVSITAPAAVRAQMQKLAENIAAQHEQLQA